MSTLFVKLILGALVPLVVGAGVVKPNILFIMADDYGWNDVGWNNLKMPTIELSKLATGDGGVILNNAYVNHLCSPTRSAFMTGKYPHQIGTQGGTFNALEPTGIPLKFEFLPELLKTKNYRNYMVGKWHLGYCDAKYAPLARGFEKFYGFYNGGEDHDYHNLRPYPEENKYLDLTDNLKPDFDQDDIYSTELFRDKTIEYIQQHKTDKITDPFFLYFSMQSVHEPIKVPSKYLTAACKANFADGTQRRTYCGMVQAMDQAIGSIVAELKTQGFYHNTIIIFTTDNGGHWAEGSSNYPLRGNKGSLWEGGTKAVSFVHSKKYMDEGQSGTTRDQLLSVVDWFPTILSLAGVSLNSETYTYDGPGIDQSKMIFKNDKTNPRPDIVYNINTERGEVWTSGGSAIRVGDYKLIAGSAGSEGSWAPSDTCADTKEDPCTETTPDSSQRNVRLFNLVADKSEKKDLSGNDEYLPKLRELRAALQKHQEDEVTSIHVDTIEKDKGHPKNFNNAFSTGWCTAK